MSNRLTAAEVLYMDSGGPARCGRCMMMVLPEDGGSPRCTVVMGPVDAEDGVCGLYAHGEPGTEAMDPMLSKATVGYGATPALGGYACGSCRFGQGSKCMHPSLESFRISRKTACCNAWSALKPLRRWEEIK